MENLKSKSINLVHSKMRVTYTGTIFKMNLLKLFFFNNNIYSWDTKTEFPHIHEEYTFIYIIQEKFHQQSQYHSLSYGKIEKLPEVENKTQQCHSFNTQKTKVTVWASA